MKPVLSRFIVPALALFAFSALGVDGQSVGKVFTVTSSADSLDLTPGDGLCADAEGRCTLRAAVEEANGSASTRDIIVFSLQYPAVIDLTLGELKITGSGVSIVGPGARRLIVQRSAGGSKFRIFGIPNPGTSAVIRGLSIHDGDASTSETGGGGAIRIGPGAILHLAEASLRNHRASLAGAVLNEGALTISRSLLQNNSAGDWGGAIGTTSVSNTHIVNTTITSNAARVGGAIATDGTLLCVNCTITHNSAEIEASGVRSGSTNGVSLLNTIVGSDVSFPVTSLAGSFLSHGNNIVTDARSSTGFVNGVNSDQVSDNNVINPLLGPLADNGGQTDTRALMGASPAINAGNSCVFLGPCPSVPGPMLRLFWDQRVGFLRQGIGSMPDIGAYESGNSQASGSVSVGSFNPLPGPRTFLYNSQVIVIDAETGTRTYSSLGPATIIRYGSGPSAATRVVEFRTKRSGMQMPPFVLAVPD